MIGEIGFPVGVPKPVENSMRFAPEPAIAVVDSTSLPGLHSNVKLTTVLEQENQFLEKMEMSSDEHFSMPQDYSTDYVLKDTDEQTLLQAVRTGSVGEFIRVALQWRRRQTVPEQTA